MSLHTIATPPVSHINEMDMSVDDVIWRRLSTDPSIQIMDMTSITPPTITGSFRRAPAACSALSSGVHTDVIETSFDVNSFDFVSHPIDLTMASNFDQALSTGSDSDLITGGKRLTRNCYSDSDITRGAVGRLRDVTVARSKSMGYHGDYECRILQPLVPRANVIKVGNIKRIASLRNNQAIKNARELFSKTERDAIEMSAGKTSAMKNSAKPFLPSNTIQKMKITQLVRQGLKSLTKTMDNLNTTMFQTPKKSSKDIRKYARMRNRKFRKTMDIGGLSDFLRRNEQRLASYPDVEIPYLPSVPEDIEQALNINSSGSDLDFERQLTKLHSRVNTELKYTPKPWAGILDTSRTTGSSNHQLPKCQRKLAFDDKDEASRGGTHDANDMNPHTTRLLHDSFMDCSVNTTFPMDTTTCSLSLAVSARPARPRLGLTCKSKPFATITLDDLDSEIAVDLKRRLEKAVRATAIKTNGSLKKRQSIGQLTKSVSRKSPTQKRPLPKPFRMLPNTAVGVNHIRLKRESFV
ncbi:hypothetical protein DPMN_122835 [Dreissena polymorpha]|uniref:Uncharacterized protein n=1 Tax=Dreissena polymorpha TaxID=45954 RepID=A0A9D4GQF2_DREPO|nr:hypothetical protein DPMN_122835 [Dreissena polymorpha]